MRANGRDTLGPRRLGPRTQSHDPITLRCATTHNYDRDRAWGYCTQTSIPQEGTGACQGQDSKARPGGTDMSAWAKDWGVPWEGKASLGRMTHGLQKCWELPGPLVADRLVQWGQARFRATRQGGCGREEERGGRSVPCPLPEDPRAVLEETHPSSLPPPQLPPTPAPPAPASMGAPAPAVPSQGPSTAPAQWLSRA